MRREWRNNRIWNFSSSSGCNLMGLGGIIRDLPAGSERKQPRDGCRKKRKQRYAQRYFADASAFVHFWGRVGADGGGLSKGSAPSNAASGGWEADSGRRVRCGAGRKGNMACDYPEDRESGKDPGLCRKRRGNRRDAFFYRREAAGSRPGQPF